MNALWDIKHEARGVDANKARGEAECFISIEAECFISRKARARQCFYYFKEFPEKCFDNNVFAGSL